MTAIASQITSLTIVYSTVYLGTDQRKHQSSASLAFVRGIHRWPVNFPHKGPVTRKLSCHIWWRYHVKAAFRYRRKHRTHLSLWSVYKMHECFDQRIWSKLYKYLNIRLTYKVLIDLFNALTLLSTYNVLIDLFNVDKVLHKCVDPGVVFFACFGDKRLKISNDNIPISQIPQCTCPISQNTSFRIHFCS